MEYHWPPRILFTAQEDLYFISGPSGPFAVPSQVQLPTDFLITSFSGAGFGAVIGAAGAAAFSAAGLASAGLGGSAAVAAAEAVSRASAAVIAIWFLMWSSPSVVLVLRAPIYPNAPGGANRCPTENDR